MISACFSKLMHKLQWRTVIDSTLLHLSIELKRASFAPKTLLLSVCLVKETPFNSTWESAAPQAVWRTFLTGFLWDCMCLPCPSTARDFPSKTDLRSSEAFRSVHEADLFSSLVCWVCVDHVQRNRMKSISMFQMELMTMFPQLSCSVMSKWQMFQML